MWPIRNKRSKLRKAWGLDGFKCGALIFINPVKNMANIENCRNVIFILGPAVEVMEMKS
jgi:hypothetical protein